MGESIEEMIRKIKDFAERYNGLVSDANGKISGELVSRERDNCLVIRIRRPLPKLAHNKITLLFRLDEATLSQLRCEEMAGMGSSKLHPLPAAETS